MGRSVGGFANHTQASITFYQCDQHCATLFANDGVSLPIANATALTDHFGSLVDENAPLYLSAPLWGAVTFFPLFLTAQVAVETATRSLVLKDVLIDTLRADQDTFFVSQPGTDLLWTSIFAQKPLNSRPRLWRYSWGRLVLAAVFSKCIRLLGSVTSQFSIPGQFSANSGLVTADHFSDVDLTMPCCF